MSGVISVGLAAFKLSTQLSPIILNGGIAANIPGGGGMLPIIAITQAIDFVAGILSSGGDINLDDFFANFQVIPGGTIIDQQIGHYPFANQAVAANAVIAQPLKVSLLMICPARGDGGYAVKLATMLALQRTIQQHNALGGTYTIITPSAFYSDCVMISLSDASNGESKQLQNAWRWDFEKPLLTQSSADVAQQALNAKMSQISGGMPTDSALTGLNVANSPASPFFSPSSTGPLGSGVAVSPGPASFSNT